MNTSDLRILQVSDCHLYADPAATLLGLNTLDALQQVLDSACAENKPDMIVVTGDLVHDGSKAGYRALARTLDRTRCRSAVIPGNHDHVPNMRSVLDQHQIPSTGQINIRNWRLILLNSQLPGEEYGHLSSNELELLENALMDSPANILIFLHHQPVPIGSKWLDNIGLDNGQELFSRIKGNTAVKGILWGHVHQSWQGQFGHIQLLATPSTCIQFSPKEDEFSLTAEPPGWRMLHLGGQGELRSEIHYLQDMPEGLIADSAGYR